MARIGRGDNCGEDSTVISQVGEDIMSAGFSGWAMCLRRGQLTLFPSPNTTTLLPTRPLSNNIDEKVWGGGGQGTPGENTWDAPASRMLYVASPHPPPRSDSKRPAVRLGEGTVREDGGGTEVAPFGGGGWISGRDVGVSTNGI